MKYARKCVCHRAATKRIGKLDFCEDCAKYVHRKKCKSVLTDVHVFTIPPKLKIYRDILVNVY